MGTFNYFQKRRTAAKGTAATKKNKVSLQQTEPVCPPGASTSAARGFLPRPQASLAAPFFPAFPEVRFPSVLAQLLPCPRPASLPSVLVPTAVRPGIPTCLCERGSLVRGKLVTGGEAAAPGSTVAVPGPTTPGHTSLSTPGLRGLWHGSMSPRVHERNAHPRRLYSRRPGHREKGIRGEQTCAPFSC